jgi:hypothetical protein
MPINSRFGRPSTIVVPGGSSSVGARNVGAGSVNPLAEFQKYVRQVNIDRSNKELLRKAGVKSDIYDNADSATLSSLAAEVGKYNVAEIESSRVNRQSGKDFLEDVENTRDVADQQFQGIDEGGIDEKTAAWRNLVEGLKGSEQEEPEEDFLGEGPYRMSQIQVDAQRDLERPPNAFGDESLNHAQGYQSQVANTFDNAPEALGRFLQTGRFKEGLKQAQARDAAEIAKDKSIFDSLISEQSKLAEEGREVKSEIKSTFDVERGVNVYKRYDSFRSGKTVVTDLDEEAAVQSMALEFGLDKLTKSAREASMKKTNERLITSGNEITRLKNIGGLFQKDFVTSFGRVKGKALAIWDSLFGLSTKSKGGKFLKKQTKFKRQTNRAFTEFKVRMTGMAAAVVELDNLKAQFLNEDADGALTFRSALKDMLQLQEDMEKVDTAYLKALEDNVRPSDAIKIRQNEARALLTKRGITFTADEKLEASQSEGNPSLKKLQSIYNIIPGAK